MPLNDSKTARSAEAAADLAKKMRLERRADREFRELFNEMAADLAATVEETGQPIRADEYTDDFAGLLLRQNRRVSAAFSGRAIGFLEDNADNEDEPIIAGLAVIAASLGISTSDMIARIKQRARVSVTAFNREQAIEDAATITRTNQAEIDFVVGKSREDLSEPGEAPPTNRQVGRASGRALSQRGVGRAATIAATTTQKVSENTKNIEREALFQARNGFNAVVADTGQEEEIVVWVTLGDGKVRPTHVAVDETRRANGGFIVGGSFLRFPGDPNGAAKEIINCRCSALLVFEERAAEAQPA